MWGGGKRLPVTLNFHIFVGPVRSSHVPTRHVVHSDAALVYVEKCDTARDPHPLLQVSRQGSPASYIFIVSHQSRAVPLLLLYCRFRVSHFYPYSSACPCCSVGRVALRAYDTLVVVQRDEWQRHDSSSTENLRLTDRLMQPSRNSSRGIYIPKASLSVQ